MSMNMAASSKGTHLVYGYDKEVAEWVGRQLDIPGFLNYAAIGIAYGDTIIGGCVYSNHYLDKWGKPLSIEMTFATIDKRWANRHTIDALMSYPFVQLRVKRVVLTIAKRNKHVRKFVEKLGFKFEGIGRKAWRDHSDACQYSLLDNEWTPYGTDRKK